MFNDVMMTSTPDEQEKHEQLENIPTKNVHNISEDNKEELIHLIQNQGLRSACFSGCRFRELQWGLHVCFLFLSQTKWVKL